MKKLLTLVLSLMLAVSAAPTAVFAETGAGTATPQPSNEDLMGQNPYKPLENTAALGI